MPDELTIEDLEKHSGLSTRTLHYYTQIGLLPGPDKRGVNASYSREHLNRLDLILILKDMHLPLKEIRTLLDRLTPIEIQHYLDDQGGLLAKIKRSAPQPGHPDKPEGKGGALDYIQSLEAAHETHRRITENPPSVYHKSQTQVLHSDSSIQTEQGPTAPEPAHDLWRRVRLADGVELHFRDTGDSSTRRKIERLLSFAQSIFNQ
jgi:DNA-binding transcriptional MerR regulator